MPKILKIYLQNMYIDIKIVSMGGGSPSAYQLLQSTRVDW